MHLDVRVLALDGITNHWEHEQLQHLGISADAQQNLVAQGWEDVVARHIEQVHAYGPDFGK
jgi:hypothetical protein